MDFLLESSVSFKLTIMFNLAVALGLFLPFSLAPFTKNKTEIILALEQNPDLPNLLLPRTSQPALANESDHIFDYDVTF